jgi:endonuclease/exonuclease/phosphatase (EEP) superfamily protein YafD
MINFTLGQKNFRRQLNSATALLNNHQGPVIISGDFNTWRPLRHRIIKEEMMKLGLEPVRFPVDSRTRFLGQAVDHIYIKNLAVTEAMAHESDSSDHNPMTIRLEVEI